MTPKQLIEGKLALYHQNVEIATYANLHDLCSALGFTDEEYNSLSNKHARDTFFKVFGRYFNYTKDGRKISILETHSSPLPPTPISRSKKKLKYTSKIIPLLFTWQDDFFCSLNNVYYNFGFFNRLCFSTLQEYNREYYRYNFMNKSKTAEEETTESPQSEEPQYKTEEYLKRQAEQEAKKKEKEENLKLFSEIPEFIDECKSIFNCFLKKTTEGTTEQTNLIRIILKPLKIKQLPKISKMMIADSLLQVEKNPRRHSKKKKYEKKSKLPTY
jgi:hypothetical protein